MISIFFTPLSLFQLLQRALKKMKGVDVFTCNQIQSRVPPRSSTTVKESTDKFRVVTCLITEGSFRLDWKDKVK